jgi:endonuclease/exonuclease/phosphatase (EEP) superfamily protein YafD
VSWSTASATPRTADVRRRPRVLRGLAWAYAALTVAALGLWYAPVAPAFATVLDLATFWWALPALVLVLLAALRRDVWALVLFALPAGLWLWSYAGAFLPGGSARQTGDLRVVSYNTFVGAPDAEHVLALIEATDPDVVLLQEVFAPREETLLAVLEDTYPHHRVDRSQGVGAVMVLSRHPIEDVEPVVDATARSRGTSVVHLDVDGRRIQVASLHLISPCPACGPTLLGRLQLEDTVRRAEVDAILAQLDPALPAVVGGDLNSGERSAAYRRFVAAGFTDPQRDVGSGMGFTWPSGGRMPPLVRIDWVLLRDLDATAARVDAAPGSDHRAVVVDVVLDGDG